MLHVTARCALERPRRGRGKAQRRPRGGPGRNHGPAHKGPGGREREGGIPTLTCNPSLSDSDREEYKLKSAGWRWETIGGFTRGFTGVSGGVLRQIGGFHFNSHAQNSRNQGVSIARSPIIIILLKESHPADCILAPGAVDVLQVLEFYACPWQQYLEFYVRMCS